MGAGNRCVMEGLGCISDYTDYGHGVVFIFQCLAGVLLRRLRRILGILIFVVLDGEGCLLMVS